MSSGRVPLEASRPRVAAGLSERTEPARDQTAEVTILVRRSAGSGAGTSQRVEAIMRGEAPPMSREEAAGTLGADPAELQQVSEFAASYGLTVTQANPAQRAVKASGSVAQMEAAFDVKLHSCGGHLCYDGPLNIPASLDGIIEAVLGLDQRPVARR